MNNQNKETRVFNPCLECGACCAYFRVSFHWIETVEKKIPDSFLEFIGANRLCMKGTNERPPRCHCLKGDVGTEVLCTIYEQRPSPCRDFMFSTMELPNEACDRARELFGLPSLNTGL